MNSSLTDLDELVLKCKDPKASSYIAEAVACYKAGAYRACIVTTWIAVVYDFLNKLRELERIGDNNARAKLTEFEKARSKHLLSEALKFEKSVLDWAKDEFEFISPIEHADLTRLIEDRNRCAHPSMISDTEPYYPPAELALYHLRNAVMYLLQHPPVQGKAALDRLKSEVESLYFPKEVEQAIQYFTNGPLANAKPVLTRRFTIYLLDSLLLQAPDELRQRCLVAAINAVREMYRQEVEKVFTERLSDLLKGINDAQIYVAVWFLGNVNDTWQFLDAAACLRFKNFVENAQETEIRAVLNSLLDVDELHALATDRIAAMNPDSIEICANTMPRIELVGRAIELYSESKTPLMAHNRSKNLIIPLVEVMDKGNIERLIECASKNDSISRSPGFVHVLRTIAGNELMTYAELIELTRKYGLSHEFVLKVYSNDYTEEDIEDYSSSEPPF